MAPENQDNRRSCSPYPAIVGGAESLQSQKIYLENESEMDDEPELISSKAMMARLGGVFPMDEAVIDARLKALPKGVKFLSVEKVATSAWTMPGQIMTLEPDGSERPYFLKVAYGEHGRIMLNGEWESSKMIHDIMPNFIPTPYAFGRYKAGKPAAYFYLSEFVDMDVTSAPDPAAWTARLAAMHKASVSPTGKFGFPIKTCDGILAHTVDWDASWASFYRKLLLGACKLDLETNGPWPELKRATAQVCDVVIPMLLDNLRTADGEAIKPCIIHGDLWEGNMGINTQTGDTLLFDAGSYFAHNEMELGHWRCEFSSVFRDEAYTRHYLQNYPAAEPVEEFDDRNRLYSLKGAINYSAGHPGTPLRKTAYNNMCYLCEKYAPVDGIDKYDPTIDPSITGARIVPHLADGLI
ncbi:hypothetical protein CHGG_11066 [Chaetomium globosum CBS 148.51]|uniref:protein-ribulosamine 3-kinase n=1 Tax=Chaetomium globosum (strain ATCC 6205 / CBS 148.51 / DSM 1962 / NBRC 6347 / NRRL 1970) TaxID=306901 RepID=Q2GLZ0_CHAGB|nr:uncharacterized protein CHGG_11066 [Chaetomium globosum CBS 148.51]EAQ82890.1 hypothetical protein CHGG_11066 [Chaetomium globosum CBS 148.51]